MNEKLTVIIPSILGSVEDFEKDFEGEITILAKKPVFRPHGFGVADIDERVGWQVLAQLPIESGEPDLLNNGFVGRDGDYIIVDDFHPDADYASYLH